MINLSTDESQVTEKSLKLRGFSEDIDLVKAGFLPLDRLNPIIEEVDGWIKDGGLNLFDKMMSYYILGHCYNARRCLTINPAKANYNDLLVWKEVFCYRTTMQMVKEVWKRKLVALYATANGVCYQALVHLGGLYDHFFFNLSYSSLGWCGVKRLGV